MKSYKFIQLFLYNYKNPLLICNIKEFNNSTDKLNNICVQTLTNKVHPLLQSLWCFEQVKIVGWG